LVAKPRRPGPGTLAIDTSCSEADPEKKAELISLGNLAEGLARAAHRREVEARAKRKRPARKRRRDPKRA